MPHYRRGRLTAPATPWEHAVGRRIPRPKSRWKRRRMKLAARQHRAGWEGYRCPHCRHVGDTERGLNHHLYTNHRGQWLFDELTRIEREAAYLSRPNAWSGPLRDDDRAWAAHPLARRYRKLLKLWWQPVNGAWGIDVGDRPALTRSAKLPPAVAPSTWTKPWLAKVKAFYPEKWPLVVAHPKFAELYGQESA